MKSICLLILLSTSFAATAQKKHVVSPNGKLRVDVNISNGIRYSVYYNNEVLISPSEIDLELASGRLSKNSSIRKSQLRTVNSKIIPTVPEKRKVINDHYNELEIQFRNSFSLIFRAYDDGIAYRFKTRFKDSIVIKNELATVQPLAI